MTISNLKTKSDVQKLIIDLCEPLKPYFSEKCGIVEIGGASAYYPKKAVQIETFSRPLWGLSSLWAGGSDYDISDYYLKGFTSGSDPDSDEYWGQISDSDQIMVEMASMGLALAIAPHKIWEPLSDEAKQNLSKWLYQINEYRLSENNWQFFNVLVNLGLKAVGMPYSSEKMQVAFDHFERFYLGDGWYSDGIRDQRDYYIPFAFHTYALIYAAIMKDEDPERSQRYIDRAIEFSNDFLYWFDETGEALPFGRSLTYRFAQTSFWSALVFANVEAQPWGVIKGIVLRHLRSWFSKPILFGDGILSVGYDYPNLTMSENYNSPGSPYWAFKTFLILAVDENHPFWQSEELPLPALDPVKVQKHPYMVFTRPERDNVIALTSGQYAWFEPTHNYEKYSKFAYSTYFSFSTPRSYLGFAKCAPDNMLAFEDDGIIRIRKKCDEFEIQGETIYSKWTPMKGITVKTWLTPKDSGHIRRHEIESNSDQIAYECGFSLPAFEVYDYVFEPTNNTSIVTNQYGLSGIKIIQGDGVPNWIYPEANTNIKHSKTIIPTIEYKISKGTTIIESFVIGLKNADIAKKELML